MKLIVPKKALLQFRRECRNAYPMEHGAFLWGVRSDNAILVITFKPIDCRAMEGKLFITAEDYRKSKMAALRKKMEWLGTIHSHPSTKDWLSCPHLSNADLNSAHAYAEGICGVVHVFNEGHTTEVYWATPMPLPEVEYI